MTELQRGRIVPITTRTRSRNAWATFPLKRASQALLLMGVLSMGTAVALGNSARQSPAAEPKSDSSEAAGGNIRMEMSEPGHMIYIPHDGPYWTIGRKLEEIRAYAGKHELTGRYLVQYLDDPSLSTRTRRQVRIGILTPTDHAPFAPFCRESREPEQVVTLDRADDIRLIPACQSIKSWAHEKGYETTGPVTEFFDILMSDGKTRRSQVQMPVQEIPTESAPAVEAVAEAGSQNGQGKPETDILGEPPETVQERLAQSGGDVAQGSQNAPMSKRRITLRRARREDPPPAESKAKVEPKTPADAQQPAIAGGDAGRDAGPGVDGSAGDKAKPTAQSGTATRVETDRPASGSAANAGREPRETGAGRPDRPMEKPGAVNRKESGGMPPAQVKAMQPGRIRLLSGEEEQTPENKRKKANRPGKIGLDGLNLFEQTPEQALARKLMPSSQEFPEDMTRWMDQFAGRIRAIGRGVDRLSGDRSSLTAMIQAVDDRHSWLKDQFEMSGEREPAPPRRSASSRSRDRKEIMQSLDRLMAQVSVKALTAEETDARMRDIISRAAVLVSGE